MFICNKNRYSLFAPFLEGAFSFVYAWVKKEGFFMKTKTTAKKLITALITLFMCALIVLSLTACSDRKTEIPATETQTETVVTTATSDEYSSVWADATYTEDATVGEGDTTFYFEVKVGTNSVTFTVNTDETMVGKALIDNGIIAGDDGPYGLYVKTVNGILADYDVNATYWGFYENGEYAMNGVDKTEIESGAHYEMVYSK